MILNFETVIGNCDWSRFISRRWRERFARAGQFRDAECFHQAEEFFDFAFVAGDFDGEALGLNVHDFGAENVGDLHDFGAGFGIHGDSDEDQFAVHVFALAEIVQLEDVDEFVQLLDDLIQSGFVAMGDDGHAGGGGFLSGGDVEGFDVVAASAEEAGDAGEDAELVFDQDGYCMTHNMARWRVFCVQAPGSWGRYDP